MILWKNWPSGLLLLSFCLAAAEASGQTIAHYINLAYQGRVEEVQQALPALKKQHPNDGAVLFLEGLVMLDGDAAVGLFNKVVQLYPTNPYADDALLKIGEFLYSRGLYIQAAQQLKRIAVHYTRSDLVHSGIRLFLNALLVSGDRDTALFYAQVFARKYPEIKFDLQAGKVVVLPDDKAVRSTRGRASPAEGKSGPRFQLQVGVYSRRENALRQQDLLESLNYEVFIRRYTSKERTLYAVIVSGFATRAAAQRLGKMLERDYGLESLVQQVD